MIIVVLLVCMIGILVAALVWARPTKEDRAIRIATANLARFKVQDSVKYLMLISTMMVDWDPVPVTEHKADERHYTISSIEEVNDLLTQRVITNPDELWHAYLTPSGGVHAFRVSHRTPAAQGVEIIKSLKGDLLYAEMTLRRNMYGVRVSPKIVNGSPRVGDFVAKPWKIFGNAPALPENLIVMELHDKFLPE
jgi:hypothetical protein